MNVQPPKRLGPSGRPKVQRLEEAITATNGGQSIRRAVGVLRSLAIGRAAGLRFTDVIAETGLSRPTAHRILRILLEEGLVEQRTRTKRYFLGEELTHLALARNVRPPLISAAEPLLTKLAQELGDTIFLTIRTGRDTLCVARYLGSFPVQVLAIEVGARRPLGVSSAGIAILAALPPDQGNEILAGNSYRMRQYSVNVEQAGNLMNEAALKGYALRTRGIVPGTKALSISFYDPTGGTTCSLTLTAVDRRLPRERIEDITVRLKATASLIEQKLNMTGLSGR